MDYGPARKERRLTMTRKEAHQALLGLGYTGSQATELLNGAATLGPVDPTRATEWQKILAAYAAHCKAHEAGGAN